MTEPVKHNYPLFQHCFKVVFPFLLWKLSPASPWSVVVLDKTVPHPDYREHYSLFWCLNHAKVHGQSGKTRWKADRDYIGFYPEKFVSSNSAYASALQPIPADLKSLLRQRNRWHRGLIDSLFYSRDMFFRSKYGSVGLFGFPYFLFIEGLGPIGEFLGYLALIPFLLLGIINWQFALLFFFIAILWGMWINIGSVLLDDLLYKRYKSLKNMLKLCFSRFFEMLGYRQLITFDRFIATFAFRKKGWGKSKRHKIEFNSERQV